MRISATDRRAALGGRDRCIRYRHQRRPTPKHADSSLGGAAVAHLHTHCSQHSELYKPTGTPIVVRLRISGMKRMLTRLNGNAQKRKNTSEATMSTSLNDSGLADKSDVSTSSADGLRASILQALRLNSPPDERARKPSSDEKKNEPPSPLTINGETTFGVIESVQQDEGGDGESGGVSQASPPLPSPVTVGGETTFDVIAPPNDRRAEDQVMWTKAPADPACEMASKTLDVNFRDASTADEDAPRMRDSSRDGRRPCSRTKLHKDGRDADTASCTSTLTGGYTPLHLAAQHGQNKIVDLLISSFNANVDARDYSGRTYRHYERNKLGTRLMTTSELHAMSATDRLSSRLSPPMMPPLQNSWSSHSIQSNTSASSSLSSSSSFTRIGSLRKAGTAAIKNLKLLGGRQAFGGSAEHIAADPEQETADRARKALSSSPCSEDSDRLLMPPPANAPARVRPKSQKSLD